MTRAPAEPPAKPLFPAFIQDGGDWLYAKADSLEAARAVFGAPADTLVERLTRWEGPALYRVWAHGWERPS